MKKQETKNDLLMLYLGRTSGGLFDSIFFLFTDQTCSHITLTAVL